VRCTKILEYDQRLTPGKKGGRLDSQLKKKRRGAGKSHRLLTGEGRQGKGV